MASLTNKSPDAPPTTDARSPARVLLTKLGPVLGLVLVIAFFSVLRWQRFVKLDNAQIIVLQTAVVGVAALGATMVIIAGGIDLSVGSVIAITTVVIARLMELGWPPLAAAIGGIAAGSFCGLITGSLITGLKLSPFIVTLGMWGALRGAAKGLAGNQVVNAPETWLNYLLSTSSENHWWFTQLVSHLPEAMRGFIPPPGVWMMFILALLVGGILTYTRFGRHVFAVGSNEQTARLCGVNIPLTKLSIYTFNGALAGVAGVLQFSFLTMGDPTTSSGLELNVIAAVVIGGASLAGGEGTIAGSLIGALIMTTVGNGCTKMDLQNWVQEIVTGAIIIFAVAIDRLRHRRT